MDTQATRSTFSPMLWLAPLPFVLAMCLPVDLSHHTAAPVVAERVATVAGDTQRDHAASAPATSDDLSVEPLAGR